MKYIEIYEKNKELTKSLKMNDSWGTFNRFCPKCYWRGGHNLQYCPQCGTTSIDYPENGITWAAYIEKASTEKEKEKRQSFFGFCMDKYNYK